MPLDNNVALVTGAGSGVGRASVVALVKKGFNIVLTGRRREKLEETVSLSNGLEGQTLIVPSDITVSEDVNNLFERIFTVYGRLDLLFNNAGQNVPGVLFEDLTLDQWKSVIDVNLTGSFLCAQHAFRMMKQQTPMGGRIINNGSISAHAPRPDSAPYTSTKHAITGLTKTLSLDGRKYDIAVSQIDIGNALTDMAARMTSGVKQANGEIAVEPVMDVTSVADAVVHIATLPHKTNIQFMTIMATKMPFVGRG
ncbi:MAG: 3-oxoacyl-ACP reductase [Magnetovibrio sp.]|nr:3-oxoacyl-ACP reductase [Magnetovibrio sp.]|tara:strand:- start:96 stop:854 length:759 start_codon:yes stop_codon:yes gene_type:complete